MTQPKDANPTWVPRDEPAAAVHPHMTDDVARVYEATANRITGQIAAAALDRAGNIGPGVRVLDIAAGAGSLSVPAALRGAELLAVDNAPGMVNLLLERLSPFATSTAQLMDGQALALDDASFDATFSMIGASIFPDWRRGLAEQVRVTRSNGVVSVATWRTLPGGGPFLVMGQAMRKLFPDMTPPAPPEGFVALAEPGQLRKALEEVGAVEVSIEEIEVVWEGRAGRAYVDDLRQLHGYMGAFATLNAEVRERIEEAILEIVGEQAIGDRIILRSVATLATASTR